MPNQSAAVLCLWARKGVFDPPVLFSDVSNLDFCSVTDPHGITRMTRYLFCKLSLLLSKIILINPKNSEKRSLETARSHNNLQQIIIETPP